jgi:hypothetical protein
MCSTGSLCLLQATIMLLRCLQEKVDISDSRGKFVIYFWLIGNFVRSGQENELQ